MARRGRLEIMIDIMTVIKRGARKKTHVMYRSNLSQRTLDKYLDFLMSYSYVEKRDNRYFTTHKALKLMNATRDIILDLNEYNTGS